jgi:inorganic pyrophosphatase
MQTVPTVHVIVEIPLGSRVKYELDDHHQLVVDRVLSTSMVYPGNYGHIPGTLAGDGDPLDALILNHDPFYPGSMVECRVVGVLFTEDEKGMDEKIMVVPITKVDTRYDSLQDVENILQKDMIRHFFEHYKHLEKDKHVHVHGWGNQQEAWKCIVDSKL